MGDSPLTADDLAALRDLVDRVHIIDYDDAVTLLDMVDGLQQREEGWKQLVRGLTCTRPTPGQVSRDGNTWDPVVGWRPLSDADPDLAALLDQALTPQGDGEG